MSCWYPNCVNLYRYLELMRLACHSPGASSKFWYHAFLNSRLFREMASSGFEVESGTIHKPRDISKIFGLMISIKPSLYQNALELLPFIYLAISLHPPILIWLWETDKTLVLKIKSNILWMLNKSKWKAFDI